MHLLASRVYAGAPGETVTVATDVEGSGAVTVFIDGQEVEDDPTFPITGNPGDETHMRISLFGAVGESCVVTISAVDGGSDGDLLLCQTLDPAPSHLYRFIVTPASALAALESVRLSRQGGAAAGQVAPPTRARKRGTKRGRSGK
jgi:hypothetical protein